MTVIECPLCGADVQIETLKREVVTCHKCRKPLNIQPVALPPDVPGGYTARWPALLQSAGCVLLGAVLCAGVFAINVPKQRKLGKPPPGVMAAAGGLFLAGITAAAGIWKRDVDDQLSARAKS